jgi:hypothetical protein
MQVNTNTQALKEEHKDKKLLIVDQRRKDCFKRRSPNNTVSYQL